LSSTFIFGLHLYLFSDIAAMAIQFRFFGLVLASMFLYAVRGQGQFALEDRNGLPGNTCLTVRNNGKL
jgi:hypothetical protein